MNKLFIFLIIIIVCAIISKYFLVKEPFSPNTLRGMENNYSVTKMKNKFNNQVNNLQIVTRQEHSKIHGKPFTPLIPNDAKRLINKLSKMTKKDLKKLNSKGKNK